MPPLFNPGGADLDWRVAWLSSGRISQAGRLRLFSANQDGFAQRQMEVPIGLARLQERR